MVVNNDINNDTEHVKFVSYDGKWPNLCRGELVLKINGVNEYFHYGYNSKDNDNSHKHNDFWMSGGRIMSSDGYMEAISGEWIIDKDLLPDEFKPYAYEIDKVFNANVPHGCCGGCI